MMNYKGYEIPNTYDEILKSYEEGYSIPIKTPYICFDFKYIHSVGITPTEITIDQYKAAKDDEDLKNKYIVTYLHVAMRCIDKLNNKEN